MGSVAAGVMAVSEPDVQDWIRHPSLTLPAYTYADVARYTRVPAQTVRNWFKGAYSPGHTMHPVMADAGGRGLSYLQLAEVAFVAAMRTRRIKIAKLRTAYDYVRSRLGVEYPFVQQEFLIDGTDLFIKALDDVLLVVSASRPGQHAWREAVDAYVNQFDYDHHLALIWHPRSRLRRVIVDPRISFGRPIVEGTGIPTEAIADRLAAGDDLASVAYDFNLTPEQVEDARWFEQDVHRAA
jgi:uncharacterized protein (DUF433 family)